MNDEVQDDDGDSEESGGQSSSSFREVESHILSLVEKLSLPTTGLTELEECVLELRELSNTHADFMFQNHILDILIQHPKTPGTGMIKDACGGIVVKIYKCMCMSRYQRNISSNEIVDAILENLFVDDIQVVIPVMRLVYYGYGIVDRELWTDRLQSERILARILSLMETTTDQLLLIMTSDSLQFVLTFTRDPSIFESLHRLRMPHIVLTILQREIENIVSGNYERSKVLVACLEIFEFLSIHFDCAEYLDLSEEIFHSLRRLVSFVDKSNENAIICFYSIHVMRNIILDTQDIEDIDIDTTLDMLFLQAIIDLCPFASRELALRGFHYTLTKVFLETEEHEMELVSLEYLVLKIARYADSLLAVIHDWLYEKLIIDKLIQIISHWMTRMINGEGMDRASFPSELEYTSVIDCGTLLWHRQIDLVLASVVEFCSSLL